MPATERPTRRSLRTRLGATEPPLDRETEQALARAFRAGNQRAGARLIAASLPFVVSIALEYRRWGAPMEDIVQQGNIGLLRAATKFEPSKDCRLATYAAYWIRAEIREYVVRAYRVVRIGTTKAERRALRAYRKTRVDDAELLAASSGMTRERAEALLPMLAGREASLDARTAEHGAIVDRLSSSNPSPEDDVSARERRGRTRRAVDQALGHLTEREQRIARERLMADEPRTLQELGAELGVSKERVRQIEQRVRDKLRARLQPMRDEAA